MTLQQDEHYFEPSSQSKMLRHSIYYTLPWIVLTIGYIIGLFATGHLHFKYPLSFLFLLRLPSLLGPIIIALIVRWMSRDLLVPLNPSKQDEELTQRARKLASTLGLRVSEVRIVGGKRGKEELNGTVIRGRIFVTQKAFESLTAGEMDSLLAHEIGHLHKRRILVLRLATVVTWTPILISLITFNAMSFFKMYTVGISASVILYVLLFSGLALSIGLWLPIQRRVELEADIIALEVTRDLEASIALTMIGEDEHPEWMAGHPPKWKRAAAIRWAADKMGLSATVTK